jgi:predicted RNase H-like nuclease (RuvC/YqgF family)
MRRIGYTLALSAMVVASALAATAQSESLGDYARAMRKQKRPPAKMVYTNDNLPTTTTISVVGQPPLTTEVSPAAGPQDEKAKAEPKEDKTSEAKAQDQISQQKKKIADLEHELDLLQREYKLQVANYYADAGTQLRDQKNWSDQEAKYRADIADKQKQIDEAKAQLQEMQEQARQADAQSSPIQ